MLYIYFRYFYEAVFVNGSRLHGIDKLSEKLNGVDK